ncbi:helix-turn-helix domain-containing protein [Chitinophaga sp. GCM10012297]|uniref:Helix-turn-helix domain-containing protein n=1 Tax=Chitinophaga chungangae TaxID=2821488 RepID=A0ABS3YAT8_9BACT|nr:AraC family transcriptional regulator [Chitinophaga chungangae]MBO9151269.1 helix-turn-helix domain-containing protein [Chitinophaga chungangae]
MEDLEKPHILYACYSHLSREGENFVPEHVFSYVMSGSMEMFAGGKKYLFGEGDYRFFRKNQLARFVKHPPAGGEYRAISVLMDKNTLQTLSNELHLPVRKPYTGDGIITLRPHNLFSSFISSLKPYMDSGQVINPALTNIKVREAAMILLETNPELQNVLFDFSEPGKIDLEAYMNEHYRFNVDIARFAYLTGRSLATFKRDFEKIYHTSPNRWLQQKRLEDAYVLLKEKGWKTSDVYMEVGFKDFSHFSYAFKKAFGMAPSMVAAQ